MMIMMQKPLELAEIAQQLKARGEELNARLLAVHADQARTREPLSLDSADRAIQCENDDVVEAIGSSAEAELFLIREALSRMEAGTFGRCLACGSPISIARLRAVPYAACCSDCATSSQR